MSYMRALLLLVLLAGCTPTPRCYATVFQSPDAEATVAVYGAGPSCEAVGDGLSAAVRLLKPVIPTLVIPFAGADLEFAAGGIFYQLPDGSLAGGEAWCWPFRMKLGQGQLRTAASSMAHEVAHWGIGIERQSAIFCGGEGGEDHSGWQERGISAAMQRWDDGE